MRTTITAGLCLALALPAAAIDTPASGWALSALPYPAQSTALTLSGGDIVTFDGASVDRWAADGSFLLQLASFPAPVFSGAAAVDPTETFLILGESSNGDVFRIDLAGGGSTLLANVFLNFDAVFVGPTELVLSAATCGFGCGNELLTLDATTGATTSLATLGGPSGPVAADVAGNLFYATQGDNFPPFPDNTNVLYLTPAQLASGNTFTEPDFGVLGTLFDGASSMTAGSAPFEVYLAQNDFGTGSNRIYRVAATEATSDIMVEGQTGNWISGLEFQAGTSGAAWAPYQPASGGDLRYVTTDFFVLSERTSLNPARAVASLSGPGLTGVGSIQFEATGLAPSGMMFLFWGPQSLYSPTETVISVGGVPFFTGLDLGTVNLLPFLLVADSAGTAQFSFFNNGSLAGLLALQGAVAELLGSVLGSTTTALN